MLRRFFKGILLLTITLAASRLAYGDSISAGKPVDFYYVRGQQDIMVPFGMGKACKTIFLQPHGGLQIDKVIADGHEVRPLSTEGFVDGPWELKLSDPGPSFRYQVLLSELRTAEAKSPFKGKAFPISDERLPALIEVFYKIRCADGTVGEAQVTRGVLLDFGKQEKIEKKESAGQRRTSDPTQRR